MKIDLIIPTYELRKRGLMRVMYSCYSLALQSVKPNKVWIIDGSSKGHFEELQSLCGHFPFVEVIHLPQDVFNKPMLLNHAIKNSDADYIIASDCDYIFKNDFIATYAKHAEENTMLLKQVKMLPRTNITENRIKKWQWSRNLKFNEWGDKANGAAQCATREWFLENPYNEGMYLLGGMDNLMVYTAELKGLTVKWVEESEILHQFHRHSPMKTNKQFKRNQAIIHETINKLKDD